jgi:hypothetical protein
MQDQGIDVPSVCAPGPTHSTSEGLLVFCACHCSTDPTCANQPHSGYILPDLTPKGPGKPKTQENPALAGAMSEV